MNILEIFFIGLIVGFIYYELIGISPGGVIAPAYFSMFIDLPQKILITLLIAFAVWGIIKFASSYLIIFGRRRLLLALLLGFCIKLIIMQWLQPMSFIQIDLQSIGYIIPGLIANELYRQSFVSTISSIIIVTTITYLIVLVI